MTLANSRVWMRVRARLVKVNHRRSHLNDLSCSFSKGPMEESQEHLEQCPGCEFERRKISMRNWRGQLIFWRRMTARITDKNREKGVAAVTWGRVNEEERVVELLV